MGHFLSALVFGLRSQSRALIPCPALLTLSLSPPFVFWRSKFDLTEHVLRTWHLRDLLTSLPLFPKLLRSFSRSFLLSPNAPNLLGAASLTTKCHKIPTAASCCASRIFLLRHFFSFRPDFPLSWRRARIAMCSGRAFHRLSLSGIRLQPSADCWLSDAPYSSVAPRAFVWINLPPDSQPLTQPCPLLPSLFSSRSKQDWPCWFFVFLPRPLAFC